MNEVEQKIQILEQKQIITIEAIKKIEAQIETLALMIEERKNANENHKKQIADTISIIEKNFF